MIEQVPITSRDQWLELRKRDITASVVGALLGHHPYVTKLELYQVHKFGNVPPEPDNSTLRRGRIFECAVAAAVAEKFPQWEITKATDYYRDPEIRLGATPDFLITDMTRGLGILETKTARTFTWQKWSGTEAPAEIVTQTRVQMMLEDADFGVIAALNLDSDMAEPFIQEIQRDHAAESCIRDAVMQFWNDVEAGNEPNPDYSRDGDLLSVIAPRPDDEQVIDLSHDNEIRTLLSERRDLMRGGGMYLHGISAMDRRKKEIETEIKFKMRDATRVEGVDGWSITWKKYMRKAQPAKPESPYEQLRISTTSDKEHENDNR